MACQGIEGFTESDTSADIAHQIMQLFGDDQDHDHEQRNTVRNRLISKNKKKNIKDEIRSSQKSVQDCVQISCKPSKKRRYRSINNLYMTTEPVNVVDEIQEKKLKFLKEP